jgi:murein DD-endopeptidase MepM/ murein hydrolase activator NlpD
MSQLDLSRARLGSRLAVAALLSAGIAGCSADIGRFKENPFDTAAVRGNVPPSEVTNSAVVGQSAPVSRVESQPLGAHASLPPPPAPSWNAPRAVAAPVQKPAPARAAAAPAPAAATHVVASGQTLISIGRHYRKSAVEIARANRIDTKSKLKIGQRLSIPGVAPTKTAAAQPAPARTAAAPGHRPAKSLVLGAPPAPLALPKQKVVAAPQPAPTGTKPVAGQQVASLQPTASAHLSTPVSDAQAEVREAQPSTTGAIPSFRWPVRGRVIAGFGPKPNGQQNDGINLAVPEGTSVKAAEDGVVAYAGNELKGYGNLLLVRHSNGYVTAYAHASELKVKRGEQVKRGQIIALAGQSGQVTSPQLHFEIRKGSTPVDPTQLLAGN